MSIWIGTGIASVSFFLGFVVASILSASKKADENMKRLSEKDVNEY